jgi:hypothetical protein
MSRETWTAGVVAANGSRPWSHWADGDGKSLDDLWTTSESKLRHEVFEVEPDWARLEAMYSTNSVWCKTRYVFWIRFAASRVVFTP